jgi:mannose-1-phosphate guanylyltransferase/mannose-6-phosphate isomerase
LKINGDDLSLLQHTYERARQLTDKIYVVSEAGHIEHVKEQLKDLDEDHFIVEPARRGTASCIVAALTYIGQRHDHDEPIASVAADHYIRDTDGFTRSFRVAEKVSASEKRIVLVGVEPDHAATGFGYIQKDGALNEESLVYNVHSFKEKPEFEVAKTYVESGNYLWNCSYFVGSINTFTASMKAHAPELHDNYQKLVAATAETYEKTYLGFENVAIDYSLMEKVPDLLVVQATFDWMDLGSFGDLHKAIGGDEQGNHISGTVQTENVTNSYIHNQSDKPLAVIGLDGAVVVNTRDGILVARKDLAQKVGEVSKRLKADSKEAE